MSWRAALTALLLSFAVSGAAAATTAGGRQAASAAGQWHPLEASFTNYHRMSASERAHVREQFSAIVDVLRDSAALREPAGVDLTPSISMIDLFSAFRVSDNQPWPAMMWIRLNEYGSECATCPPRPSSEWSNAFIVIANAIDALYSNWRSPEVKFGRDWYYLEPKIIRHVGTFPLYDTGQVVVTRRTAPLFVRVTQEQFLARRIQEARNIHDEALNRVKSDTEAYERFVKERPERQAKVREQVKLLRALATPEAATAAANLEKSSEEVENVQEKVLRGLAYGDPATDEGVRTSGLRLKQLEAELAALTSQQRASPAVTTCGRGRRPSGLCPSWSVQDRALVFENPDFYDRRLPRTAFQILFIGSNRPADRKTPSGAAIRGAWETLDWQRLSDLLH